MQGKLEALARQADICSCLLRELVGGHLVGGLDEHVVYAHVKSDLHDCDWDSLYARVTFISRRT